MPDRAMGILMALGGLVAVVGLVIVGIDVYAAKERGPRWKRRLLGAGLAVLGMMGAGAVVWPRPTCYAMPPMPFTAPSLQRLEKQTFLLYQFTAQGRVDPEVARKALAVAEAALAEASNEETLKRLSSEERARAEGLREQARAQIERLRGWIAAGPLADSPEWRALVETWREAKEVTSGRRPRQGDLLSRLHKASLAAVKFGEDGLLTWAEAGLLSMESESLAECAGRFRPADVRGAASYKPVASFPAKESAVRLAQRLPLLEKLAGQERLLPTVMDMILAAIERDLAVLADEKALATLATAERAGAEKTREAAKAAVEKLKKLLDADKAGRK